MQWFRTLDANTVGWLIIVAMQGLSLWYSRRTEKNTNSMKDALVASTAKESFAAGVASEKAKS